MSELEEVTRRLSIAGAPPAWAAHWAPAQAAWAAGGRGFLAPEPFAETCRWLRMDPQVREALLAARGWMEGHAEARQLAWLGHFLLYEAGAWQEASASWPVPGGPGPESEYAVLFWAVVLLSGADRVRERHRRQGVAEEVSRDTLSDLELWLKHQKQAGGRWEFKQLAWLTRHFSGRLYKLGRLQFDMERFDLDLHAFRNRSDGRIVVLAGEGLRFRADGQYADADRQVAAEGVWTARLDEGGGRIRGNPFHPGGFAQAEAVVLESAQWERILSPGDAVLGTHIPACGPMGHAECGDSHAWALRFFPAHFPAFPFRAFTCYSWLLDPQWQRYLRPESNIVRYQREFFLIPLAKANDHQHFERIFGGPLKDLDRAPQETSVQRAAIAHVRAGGKWRMGGSLLFRDAFRWGGAAEGAGLGLAEPLPEPPR